MANIFLNLLFVFGEILVLMMFWIYVIQHDALATIICSIVLIEMMTVQFLYNCIDDKPLNKK